MSDWLNRLRRGDILVCDGGLGTSIQARGLATGDCPERLIPTTSSPSTAPPTRQGPTSTGATPRHDKRH